MNQIEMNSIAINFLKHESYKVAKKLEKVLAEDLKEKCEELSGTTLHHIHNMALFDVLLMINCLFTSRNNPTKEAAEAYCRLGESLRPKFLEIVETLKDFVPEERSGNNENDNQA